MQFHLKAQTHQKHALGDREMTAEEYQKHQEEEAKWSSYFTEQKSSKKDDIHKRFFAAYTDKRVATLDELFDDLKKRDLRSMILIGCAYIEELCKECFLSTLTEDSRSKFIDAFNTNITFSFASNILYAQDYISKDIILLIDLLRKVRNDLAHNAVLTTEHRKSIDSRIEKLKELTSGRLFTRFESEVKKMDEQQFICFMLIENLCYSFITLSMWILPTQRLAKMIFHKEYPFVRVLILVDNFNTGTTEPLFEKKFGD